MPSTVSPIVECVYFKLVLADHHSCVVTSSNAFRPPVACLLLVYLYSNWGALAAWNQEQVWQQALVKPRTDIDTWLHTSNADQ